VIEVPAEYMKSIYEGYIARSTKTHGLYAKLVQDSLALFNAVRPHSRRLCETLDPGE
jgi:hypothetical protein